MSSGEGDMAGDEECLEPVEGPPVAFALDDVTTEPGRMAPGAASRVGLSRVTLGVRVGRFLAAVGEPGSGVTELLDCLAGTLPPVLGRVHRAAGWPVRRVRPTGLPLELRAWEVVAREVPGGGAPELRCLWRAAGLRWRSQRRVADLSAAARQRLAVARAAAAPPAILLAAQPASAPRGEGAALAAALRGVVDACGITAVLSTADAAAAARADTVVFLHRGRFVDVAAGGNSGAVRAYQDRIGRRM
ncbi:hypothetical protein ACFVIM_04425 [Streptomyces sp. NPDC057638]|uniref:hypothetical protein n=1 Tax=Streptomyces sp. NPDC057638 TaxID=3346190 RepID=UPI0036B690C3